jgi:hypothetical protein
LTYSPTVVERSQRSGTDRKTGRGRPKVSRDTLYALDTVEKYESVFKAIVENSGISTLQLSRKLEIPVSTCDRHVKNIKKLFPSTLSLEVFSPYLTCFFVECDRGYDTVRPGTFFEYIKEIVAVQPLNSYSAKSGFLITAFAYTYQNVVDISNSIRKVMQLDAKAEIPWFKPVGRAEYCPSNVLDRVIELGREVRQKRFDISCILG